MTHVTCRLTANNRDQLRNPTLGNRTRATFTFFCSHSDAFAASRPAPAVTHIQQQQQQQLEASSLAPPPRVTAWRRRRLRANSVATATLGAWSRAPSHMLFGSNYTKIRRGRGRRDRPASASHCSQIIITRRKPLARRGHDAVLLGRRASGGNKRDKTSERAL